MTLWDLPQKPKLLIVDDDLDFDVMLCTYFRQLGAEVEYTLRADEAVSLCAQADYDLVVLDIRLPDNDGYEVCRQLRQQRRTQDTPIIFLTERRGRLDKLQGLELGAVDYITKPFDIEELRLRIRNALKHRVHQRVFSPNRVALLRQTLVERFDLEELRTLCFDLEVGFDRLRGDGQEAKARELIAYLQRRERLGDLVSYIRQRRPDIKLS